MTNTRRLILPPNELKTGDRIIGARVNYVNHKSDHESTFTPWEHIIVGITRNSRGMLYTSEILVKSHHMCDLLVERERTPDEEPIYIYKKGEGWVVA